ncbi:MAG TPA: toll/interleukin-1 receptor domain-containing protein [Blastocatellia bacterium]|nr:toll/interleukin-1 receptor domain-containing protein [Blastocatellia bacterium]
MRAYVPGFDYDFFISYAHVNNQSKIENEKGWVTNFNDSFKLFLAEELGRRESFSGWIDDKLRGNNDFDDEIKHALRSSAILIFIYSEGYVSSRWCRQELSYFCELARPDFKLKVNNQFRLFRVELDSVDEIPHDDDFNPVPELNSEMTGYKFYEKVGEIDAPHRRVKEWDPDQRYWEQMRRVAVHVADLLKQMKKRKGQALHPPKPKPDGKPDLVIYLAETTDDLEDERYKLKTALENLEDKGVRVVPELPLSLSDPNLAQTIRNELSKATISIHLIGKYHGKKPVNEERSIVRLQRDLALEISKEKKLDRLFWLPPELDLDIVSAPHREFIESLEEKPGDAPEAELRRCGIEELKEIVLSRILPPAPPPDSHLIYLPFLPQDRNGAVQLKKLLREEKLDIRLLAHDAGDLERLKPHHESSLNSSDAVLIYYGHDALWAETRALETRDIAKVRRSNRPLKAMAICDGPPVNKKDDLGVDFEGLIVVDCRDTIDPKKLQSFIKAIKS